MNELSAKAQASERKIGGLAQARNMRSNKKSVSERAIISVLRKRETCEVKQPKHAKQGYPNKPCLLQVDKETPRAELETGTFGLLQLVDEKVPTQQRATARSAVTADKQRIAAKLNITGNYFKEAGANLYDDVSTAAPYLLDHVG